jgi:outer membrane protein OmpA-like peptidoglycan-associated protein
LQWSIVRGALLLFVTNLAAIALAVAAVAEWYGFGRGGLRKRFARRAVISLLVLAPLAVPLFISLRSIAWESRANAAVREILETEAHRLDQGQLAQFHVHIGYGAPAVEAIVVSAKPESGLEARMTDELRQALGTPVTLHLTQLQANDPARVSAALELAPAKTPVKPPLREQMEATVRSELPYALTAVDVDMEQHRIVVVPKGDDHVDLAGWRDIESRLAARHADQQVTLVPPAGALPAIAFARGKNSLDDAATKRLQLVLWTLERWNAKQVELVGHAGTRADGALAMARKRAAAVGRWFGDHGIVATQSAVYPLPRQSALERERGDAAFRSVDIGLPAQRTER